MTAIVTQRRTDAAAHDALPTAAGVAAAAPQPTQRAAAGGRASASTLAAR